MKKSNLFFTLFFISILIVSCSKEKPVKFNANFDNINDRVWLGKDFWSIPMEDWQIKDGRLECVGQRVNMRLNVLTQILDESPGTLSISVRMGLLKPGEIVSSAGLRIGIFDSEDADVRASCYFGKGINLGVTTDYKLFIEKSSANLPDDFNYEEFILQIDAEPINSNYSLKLIATDNSGKSATIDYNVENLKGLVALVNHFNRVEKIKSAPRFWFDDLHIKGTKVRSKPDNSFGPILWSMYTMSRGVVKLTAQMPPLGNGDNKTVQLFLKEGSDWEKTDEQTIKTNSRIATFRMDNWGAANDVEYRLVYLEKGKDGIEQEFMYEGIIRRDPIDRPLDFGGLTCQYGTGFPYSPLVKNLTQHNPDMLYFSGDQIYEGNGGYSIIRFPADSVILNYLGKWYMFGWAFGDLMRDRPTVCIPDDHDVFQGNLWGNEGNKIEMEGWRRYHGTEGGYIQPAEMVNVVHETQCAHLPDPFDPTPIQQNIKVYYTDLVYGRVSFAIISDRMFKSGPNEVAFWQGRQDHIQERLPDMSVVDNPNLKMLGERQLEFLEEWVQDWRGVDLKVLLSQTVFANIATHHGGNKMVLFGDLDSGGWPKTARDKALEIIRKGFAFHIVGDQHLPSLTQYGIDDFQDAGWCFCTPAIYVGYERRFLPASLGWNIQQAPNIHRPNTGFYEDPFGSPHYIYAMGNPVDEIAKQPRYVRGQDKSSGYGLVHFDQKERTIRIEAYRFLADSNKEKEDNQFPGWPHTISQLDNYGRIASGYLPTFKVSGVENPVILVTNEKTKKLEYAVRIKGNQWTPKVFSDETFSIKVGDPDLNKWKTLTNLASHKEKSDEVLEVKF